MPFPGKSFAEGAGKWEGNSMTEDPDEKRSNEDDEETHIIETPFAKIRASKGTELGSGPDPRTRDHDDAD
jgi:hypothetical protein